LFCLGHLPAYDPIRDCLGSVLAGLSNFPISRIAELTPPGGLETDRPDPETLPTVGLLTGYAYLLANHPGPDVDADEFFGQ
jgi:hypothetical protein